MLSEKSLKPNSGRFTRRSRRMAERGFTLVEVLIATVLIVVGVAGALAAISAGVRAQSAGEFYNAAALLGQQKMAELELDPDLAAGTTSGDFMPDHPGYQWTATVQEAPSGLLQLTPAIEEQPAKEAQTPPESKLWEIHLEVTETQDAKSSRKAELDTYILKRDEQAGS